MNDIKIIIAGEGGQGIQTMAKVISSYAGNLNYHISYIPSFGVEQRGTPSVAFITLSKEKEINYPRFDKADYAIIMQQRALKSVEQYICKETKVIFDSSSVDAKSLNRDHGQFFAIPAIELSIDKFVPKAFNVMMLGKIASLLMFPKKDFWRQIENSLIKKLKDEKLKKSYFNAFIFGYDFALEKDDFTLAKFFPNNTEVVLKGHGKIGRIIPSRCKSCGICHEKCPVKAISYGETLGAFAGPTPEVDLEKCIACGNCQRFCPDAAIYIKKEKEL